MRKILLLFSLLILAIPVEAYNLPPVNMTGNIDLRNYTVWNGTVNGTNFLNCYALGKASSWNNSWFDCIAVGGAEVDPLSVHTTDFPAWVHSNETDTVAMSNISSNIGNWNMWYSTDKAAQLTNNSNQESEIAGKMNTFTTWAGLLNSDIGATQTWVNNQGFLTSDNDPFIPLSSQGLFETISNKSTDTALGTSNILYPTQKAVKDYVDAATSTLNATVFNNTVNGSLMTCGDSCHNAHYVNYSIYNVDLNNQQTNNSNQETEIAGKQSAGDYATNTALTNANNSMNGLKLNKTEQATDSLKLNGQSASYYEQALTFLSYFTRSGNSISFNVTTCGANQVSKANGTGFDCVSISAGSFRANTTSNPTGVTDYITFNNSSGINATLVGNSMTFSLNTTNVSMITGSGGIVTTTLNDGSGSLTNITVSGGLIATWT